MTTRRLQPAYTHANRHTIAVIGDSIVRNYSLGVWTSQFWPEQLALLLRAAGAYVKARNLGSSGNTTTQMLARIYALVENDVPDIAFIAGGVNDPGNAISSATTTANILAMITYLKNAGVSRIVVALRSYTRGSARRSYSRRRPKRRVLRRVQLHAEPDCCRHRGTGFGELACNPNQPAPQRPRWCSHRERSKGHGRGTTGLAGSPLDVRTTR
jgi:lysophospholipase L1-like esterase